jgi:hypothetical protein
MTDKPDDDKPAPDDAEKGGTPDDEAKRNAEAAENQGKLIASLQEKAARVNAAEAEAKAAREELERMRQALSPAAPITAADPRADRIAKARQWAEGTAQPGAQPDPVAGLVLDVLDELKMTQQEVANLRAIDKIGDAALADKVQKHFNENRHRLGDVKAARAEVEAELLRKQIEEEKAERERLAEALRIAQAPTGTAPPTHHREVGAPTLKAQTFDTLEDFEEAMKGKPTLERLAMQEAVEKGTIKIKRAV